MVLSYICSVAKCETSAYGGVASAGDDSATPTPTDIAKAWSSSEYPILHPFGEDVHLDEFVKVRMAMGGPASDIVGDTHHNLGDLRKLREAHRFVAKSVKEAGGLLDGKAKDIYSLLSDSGPPNPHMVTPDVDQYLQPILEQCVENVRDPSSIIVDEEPTIVDAHDAYSNPARFAAEQKVIFGEGLLIVGPIFQHA